MDPQIRMAVVAWRPAQDGASWAEINAAWKTLHALVTEAARLRRAQRS